MPRRSLNELLPRFDHLGPERAYVFRNGYRTLRWSYREIAALARRFARELERRGIGRPVSYRPDENPNSIARDLERRMREL
jgi:hypothetical protein